MKLKPGNLVSSTAWFTNRSDTGMILPINKGEIGVVVSAEYTGSVLVAIRGHIHSYHYTNLCIVSTDSWIQMDTWSD